MTRVQRVPRTLAEVLALRAGVSVEYAGQYMNRLGVSQEDRDRFRQERGVAVELARADAWRDVDDEEIEDALTEPNPKRALKASVERSAEYHLRARMGAHALWAKVEDPVAHTEPARKAFAERFEKQVDPEGKLSPEERRRRAEHAKKAYFTGLALKSAKARRKKKEGRDGS